MDIATVFQWLIIIAVLIVVAIVAPPAFRRK